MFSIATINDSERKILEPYASSIQDRLKAMKELSERGIKTTVFLGPVYPTVEKEDIPPLIDAIVKCGGSEIMFDKFNLKPGIFENLKKFNISNSERVRDEPYFREIFNEMKKCGEERKIKIVKAF
jgi:DNA repair photolyase